jgi:DNA-binding CsgD family transcriptional regulator
VDRELRPHAGRGRIGNVIIARRENKRPILIKVLPVHGAARSPFLGARFILSFRDLDAVRRTSLDVLAELFALTPAEARVASMIAAGSSPEEVADDLNLARETVRNQIKAIFGKTDTHRQNELAALISRLDAEAPAHGSSPVSQ